MGAGYFQWKWWLSKVEIVAFINNSKTISTNEFEGRPIIHSNEIHKYLFDSVVVAVTSIDAIYDEIEVLKQKNIDVEVLSYKENICNINTERKRIEVAFNNIANVGDQLNSFLMDNLFNVNVALSSVKKAQFIAIGSVLEELFDEKSYDDAFSEETIYVWGSGFIMEHDELLKPIRDINILALRGKKSKDIMSKSLKAEINCVLADPGLLVSRIYPKEEKKYDVGIVPHYVDYDNEAIIRATEHYPNSVLIDVRKNPSEVIREIASCKTVISTSLHGLIIADSFGIPNKWIKCSDKIIGDTFKFMDYYSSYGISNQFIDINYVLPNIEDVVLDYKIQIDDVLKKQEQLMECFPK